VKPGVGELPIGALLCDADGCLFPSEEPAFDACAEVTNGFLAELGSSRRFSGEALRLATTGMNFRTTASRLAAAEGRALEPAALAGWVESEQRAVTAHLATVLRPDPLVSEPLERLAAGHALALVSSSAAGRIDVCLQATELQELFPRERRFSAESSLPVPTSKPDPAIYLHALARLGLEPERALAVEDSIPGAESAIAAGCPTIGNVMFVPSEERAERRQALERAGVVEVVSSWGELELLLEPIELRGAGVSA
jgi:beta-phosphoglucomutase-like phosphatase (HAD superfamily)